MLCKLNDFLYESNNVNLDSIDHKATFTYEKTTLINAHDDWQSTGRFSKEITLSGVLIKKSNSSLDGLEKMAQKKEPVTLAFSSEIAGHALKVVILSINTKRSSFLRDGLFLKQDFEVELGVIYGNT